MYLLGNTFWKIISAIECPYSGWSIKFLDAKILIETAPIEQSAIASKCALKNNGSSLNESQILGKKIMREEDTYGNISFVRYQRRLFKKDRLS